MPQNIARVALIATLITALGGCSPQVGSQAWCQKMEDTPGGDWSGNQVRDYAQHCLFK